MINTRLPPARSLVFLAGAGVLFLTSSTGLAVQRVAVFPTDPGGHPAAVRLQAQIDEFHDVVVETGAAVQQALLPCKSDVACVVNRGRNLGLDLVVLVDAHPVDPGTIEVQPTVIDLQTGQAQAYKSDFWVAGEGEVAAQHTAMRIFRPDQVVGGVLIDGPPDGKVLVDGIDYGSGPYTQPVKNLSEKVDHQVTVISPRGTASAHIYVKFRQATHLTPRWAQKTLEPTGSSDIPYLDLAPLSAPHHDASPGPAVSETRAQPEPATQTPAPTGGWRGGQVAGLVLVGVGIVGLALGVGEEVQARSANSDFEVQRPAAAAGSAAAQARANADLSTYNSSSAIAVGGFIGGGVCALGGAALFLLTGRSDAPPVAVAWHPGGPALVLNGTF